MSLSAQEVRQVLTSARQLSLDAPVERVEEFFARILRLNTFQQGQYFPDPDPDGLLVTAIGHLTTARDEILQEVCAVPGFAVYKDDLGVFQIAGLNTYLESKDTTGSSALLRERLSQHSKIRTALRRLEDGQHLEALAAAIMDGSCNSGQATRRTADQGIDAIGWKELMMIDSAFSNGSLTATDVVLPGEKVFLFASSKAVIGTGRGKPKLLDPAHIRELVGGWVIQRSTAGIWRGAGIQMLSPVQMILVTTYRLSTEAKGLCRELGIQVWGMPELIYFICRWAPDTVFEAPGDEFSTTGFRSWWKMYHQSRLMAS